MMTTVYPDEKLFRPSQRDFFFVAASVLFSFYLFWLAKLLFFQFDIHWGFINVAVHRNTPARELLAMANVVPFRKILYYARGCEAYFVGVINVAGNVLMFVPMGFALPFFFTGLQNKKRLAATVAAVSLAVELLQLITATGVFDADDVLLNTFGAVAGCWIFCFVKKQARQGDASTGKTQAGQGFPADAYGWSIENGIVCAKQSL